MFAFGSELAVVPVTETSQKKPSNNWHRSNSFIPFDNGRAFTSCPFTSDTAATVYAPSNMISTLVGRGGDNVRALQDQLGGLRLTIESLDDMPDSDDVSEHSIWSDDQIGGRIRAVHMSNMGAPKDGKAVVGEKETS